MKKLPYLLPLILIASGCLTIQAGPSPREKEILAKARPGVPVTLPGRSSDVVMKVPAHLSASSSSDGRMMMRGAKKSPTRTFKTSKLKVQAFWFGGGEGKRRVVIDLSHQVAQVWAGDTLVGQSPVSTGKEGHGTPDGQYYIQQKNKDHHSNLYGSWVDASGKYAGDASAGDKKRKGMRYVAAPMPYFLRLTGSGIGMHAGFVPGFPASHGCIRLPHNMAEKFFDYLPMGAPVEIMH